MHQTKPAYKINRKKYFKRVIQYLQLFVRSHLDAKTIAQERFFRSVIYRRKGRWGRGVILIYCYYYSAIAGHKDENVNRINFNIRSWAVGIIGMDPHGIEQLLKLAQFDNLAYSIA